MSDETPAPNGAPPAPDPDNVWVQLDTLKDAAIEEVHEDDDLMLVVGDIDIEPKYQYNKPTPVIRDQDETTSRNTGHNRILRYGKRSLFIYCDHCDFRTLKKKKMRLIFHLKSKHMKTELLQCNICTFSTVFHNSMRKHLTLQHKTFECPDCPYKTIIKHNFNMHKKKHADTQKYAVKICQKLLRQSNSNERKYYCDKCPYKATYKTGLIKHFQTEHKKKLKKEPAICEYCHYRPTKNYYLKHHKEKNLQENLIKCHQCEFESYYMCEYRMHKKTHPQIKPPKPPPRKRIPYIEDMGVSFKDFVIVNGQKFPRTPNAIMKYTKTKNFLINTQGIIDIENIPVETFTIGQGKGGEGRMFRCKQCTFTSPKKDSVKWHVHRDHTDKSVMPYLCLNCEFTSKTRESMRKHVKRSGSMELLHCENCQFTTKFMCQLKMHVKSHNPYNCKQCTSMFSNENKLKQHYGQVHTHSFYKCGICEFSTTRKDRMAKHESGHTGHNHLKCQDCEYSCVTVNVLRAHRKKFHPPQKLITDGDEKESVAIRKDRTEPFDKCASIDNNMDILSGDIEQ